MNSANQIFQSLVFQHGSVKRACVSLAAVAMALLAAVAAPAAIFPSQQLVDWTPGTMVGVPGGIPTYRTNLIDVTKAPYNADKTGVNDTTAAIQSAINSAQSNQVVYLPAGIYRVNNPIFIYAQNKGITVRGAGSNTVIMSYTTYGETFSVGGAYNYQWNTPASGNNIAALTKGSTNVTIADTSAFAVGTMAKIAIADNTSQTANPVTMHVSGYGGLREQKVIIKAKTATTLTFWPPLYSSYEGHVGQVFNSTGQSDFVGLENFYLECSNSTAPYGIQFEQAYGSWVKGVHIHFAYGYVVFFYDSLNCQMEDCFVDQANHSGPNGSGFLTYYACACLFQNNIIYKTFPLIEVDFGSAGNVFAYNYLSDSTSDGIEGAAIDSNHGPHNNFNLYEGNISPNLECDGYFGSTSQDTLFRNWFHGVEPELAGVGYYIKLCRFTRDYYMVGNIFGITNGSFSYGNGPGVSNGGILMGFPNIGNNSYSGAAPPWATWGTAPGPNGFQEMDTNVAATSVLLGNYYYYTKSIPAAESLGTNTLPNSLYLTSKPAWFGNLSWPPFNPSSPSPTYDAIPAGYRFDHGVEPPGVGQGPTAVAAANPTSGLAPLAVNFSSAGSSGGTLTYNWTFGDGTTSTAANPSHTYSSIGSYLAFLTVSDGTNQASSGNITITVTNLTFPPIVAANASPLSGPAPLLVTFSSLGSSDPGGLTLSYNWSFGDGSTSTNANPSHTYAAGVYSAQLTISDGLSQTVSALIPITVTGATSTNGLVAAYGFEEGSGNTVSDTSGNGNTGAISGATWTTGMYGSALSFSGSSSVTVNNSASLNLTTGMTLEAWVYPTSLNSQLFMSILFKPITTGSTVDYVLQGSSRTSEVPSVAVSASPSNLNGPSILPLNSWSHLAGTYDGANIRLYVNGVQVASQAQTGAIAASTQPVTIGANWSGLIDEVRIYNRALGSSQIQADMANSVVLLSPPPPTPTGLKIISN